MDVGKEGQNHHTSVKHELNTVSYEHEFNSGQVPTSLVTLLVQVRNICFELTMLCMHVCIESLNLKIHKHLRWQ